MSFATYFVLEMKSLKAAVQLLQCQRQGRKHGTAVPGSVGPKSIMAGTDRMFITCISSRFLDFLDTFENAPRPLGCCSGDSQNF